MGIGMGGIGKRVFYESGAERFIVYGGKFHLDYPMDDNKQPCIQDAEEVVTTLPIIP